jgi:hypothetical protein
MSNSKDALGGDLNTVIVSAVNARVEAAVAEALSGDEVIGKFVTSALRQTVEVPKADGSYGKERVTFLKSVIDKALQQATKQAVLKVMAEEEERLEKEVRKALRASTDSIAKSLVSSVKDATDNTYRFQVNIIPPTRD